MGVAFPHTTSELRPTRATPSCWELGDLTASQILKTLILEYEHQSKLPARQLRSSQAKRRVHVRRWRAHVSVRRLSSEYGSSQSPTYRSMERQLRSQRLSSLISRAHPSSGVSTSSSRDIVNQRTSQQSSLIRVSLYYELTRTEAMIHIQCKTARYLLSENVRLLVEVSCRMIYYSLREDAG